MSEGVYALAAVLTLAACAIAYRRWGWAGVASVLGGAWALVATVAAAVRRRGVDLPDAPTLDRAAREAAAERERAEWLDARARALEAGHDAAESPEDIAARMNARARGET